MAQCLFGRFVYCCMGRLTVRLYFVGLILIWGVVFMPRPSNGNVEAKNLKKIIDGISESFESASESRDLVSFFGSLVAGFREMRNYQVYFNTGSDKRAWGAISKYVDEVINRGGKVTKNDRDAVRSEVLKAFVRKLRLIHKNLPYGGLIAKYVTGAGFGEIRESLWRAIERLDVFSTNDEFIKLFGDHVVRCLEHASSCSDVREFKNLVKGAFSMIGNIINSDNNGDEFMILPKVTKDMLSSFWGKFREPLEAITKSRDLKFGLEKILKPLKYLCEKFSGDKLLSMAAKPAKGAFERLKELIDGGEKSKLVGKKKIN